MDPEAPLTLDEIVGTPYQLGGRDATGIDCLGVTMLVVRHHAIEFDDPWAKIEIGYQEGHRGIKTTLDALPSGWVKVSPPPMNGDLIITPGHVSAYSGGWVFSAVENIGGTREPWSRFASRATFTLWRHLGE